MEADVARYAWQASKVPVESVGRTEGMDTWSYVRGPSVGLALCKDIREAKTSHRKLASGQLELTRGSLSTHAESRSAPSHA